MTLTKRWSLSVPVDGFSLGDLTDLAREGERLGYTDAWSYEADGLDCFAPLAVVATATKLRLGTAIANVFTRGPATLAMSAASIADLAPGRFCLGIGAGSQPIVEAWNGGRFALPATRVREMTGVLRAALAGERVVFKGKTLSVDGFRLARPPAHPVPIYIAALRPGMLQVAGEVGDGVILNWLSAGDVRRHVTAYLNVQVYRAYQDWLGRGPILSPMWEAWERGDRKAAVAAVPEAVMRDLILRGSMADIRAHVRRYLDAGIDTAFLQVSTLETDSARRRQVLGDALRALAPSA